MLIAGNERKGERIPLKVATASSSAVAIFACSLTVKTISKIISIEMNKASNLKFT